MMRFRPLSFAALFLGVLLLTQCTKDMLDDPTPDSSEMDGMEQDTMAPPTIWTGPVLSFAKASGSNPNQQVNQDRITDNVWITRGISGGQIFNIAVESSHNKARSPEGTEWAEGRIEDWEGLNYQLFRAAVVRPKNVVGKTYVVHLLEDDIYLQVRFTNWSQNQGGGFAYERTTPE